MQIREKNCANEEFIALVLTAARVLHKLNIPLIVNDRVDLALAARAQGVRAQGVHVGQADVDYLGVSTVFKTQTKLDVSEIWGIEGLKTL